MRGGYAAGLLTAAALAAACATAGVSVEEAVSLEPQGPPLAAPDAATPTDAGARTDATPGAGGGCDTPCGIDPQCGCGARETCDLDEGGARRCVAAGTAPAGRACRGTGECAPGLLCAGGVCRSPCTAVGDKCPSAGGGFCLEYARTSADAGAGGPTHAACEVPCAYDDAGSCGFAPGDAIAGGVRVPRRDPWCRLYAREERAAPERRVRERRRVRRGAGLRAPVRLLELP